MYRWNVRHLHGCSASSVIHYSLPFKHYMRPTVCNSGYQWVIGVESRSRERRRKKKKTLRMIELTSTGTTNFGGCNPLTMFRLVVPERESWSVTRNPEFDRLVRVDSGRKRETKRGQPDFSQVGVRSTVVVSCDRYLDGGNLCSLTVTTDSWVQMSRLFGAPWVMKSVDRGGGMDREGFMKWNRGL